MKHGIPPGIFEPTARQLVDRGYLADNHGRYRFTETGAEVFGSLVTAWRTWLVGRLDGWTEQDERQFMPAIDSLAEQLIAEGRALSVAG